MKKIFVLLSALFVALAANVSNVQAQAKTTADDSALLYEITGKNVKKPSYLFGTIHLICEKDMFPAEKLKSYINQTEQLMLEIDMDNQTEILKAAQFALLANGKTVKDYVKPDEYTKIDELFKSYVGISFDNLKNFKPVISQTYLLTSPKILGCQPPVAYERFLTQMAVTAKKPVIGLETVEQQFAVLDSMPLDKQLKAFNEMAANPEKTSNDFKTLTKTYLTQNSDELYNILVKQSAETDFSLTKLLDERNVNWIPVIEKNISVKPTFIAVGGGHLSGKSGVVSLLRAKGYQLKPIKL